MPAASWRALQSPWVQSLRSESAFHLIAPFLGPVIDLLDDESVTEVMINPGAVFVERGGCLTRVEGRVPDSVWVQRAAVAIARSLGDDGSRDSSLLNAHLPESESATLGSPSEQSALPLPDPALVFRRWQALEDVRPFRNAARAGFPGGP